MKRKAGIVSVSRACFLCKKDHKACNGARPCSRCISLEVPDRCEDVALKPRGRPRKTKVGNTSPDTAATTASSSTTTTSRRMTDGGTSSTVLLRSETTTIVKKREDPRRSSNPTANNARKHSPPNRHAGNHHYNDFPRKNGLTPSSFELGGDPDDDEAALAMVSSFPLLRETAQKSSSSSSHPGLHHPATAYGVSTFPWPYPPSTNTLPVTTSTEPKDSGSDVQHLCHRFKILQNKVQQTNNNPVLQLPTPPHHQSYQQQQQQQQQQQHQHNAQMPLQPQPLRPAPQRHQYSEEVDDDRGWLRWRGQASSHTVFPHQTNEGDNSNRDRDFPSSSSYEPSPFKPSPQGPFITRGPFIQHSSSALAQLPSFPFPSPSLGISPSTSELSSLSAQRGGGEGASFGAFHDYKLERKRKQEDVDSDDQKKSAVVGVAPMRKKGRGIVGAEKQEEEEEDEEEEVGQVVRAMQLLPQQPPLERREEQQQPTTPKAQPPQLFKASLSFVCN